MTVYTLFGQTDLTGVANADGTTIPENLSTKFSVSADCTLTGIWFYSASGLGRLPDQVGLYDDDTNTKIFEDDSPTWSGAFGSGWIKYTPSSPPSLTSDTNYKPIVTVSSNNTLTWYSITAGYWSDHPGPVTNGPLSCPDQPNYWDESGVFANSQNTFGTYNIWIDPEVTTASSVTGTADVTLKKMTASGSGDVLVMGVTDDLVRADASSLGSNWIPWSFSGAASASIVSNQAKGASAQTTGDYWSAGDFYNDQYSEVTAAALPTSNDWLGCSVRQSGTGGDGYVFLYWNNAGSPQFQLYKTISGAVLLHAQSGTLSVNDVLKVSAIGTTIRCYKNGVLLFSVTDSAYSSGRPGLGFFGSSARISSWSGGSVVSGTADVAMKKMTVSASDGLYTAWSSTIPGGTTVSNTGPRNDGLYFSVTQSGCRLKGIAFYVPSSESNLTGSNYTATLYSTTTGATGTQIAQANGSGTFTAGAWNWIPFDVALSTGVDYVGAIHHPANLQFKSSFWLSTASFDNGPLHIPSQASSPGQKQQPFLAGATAFPQAANNPATWYGVDIKVTTNSLTTVTGTADVTLKKMIAAASGTEIDRGIATVTLKKMTVSASGNVIVHGTASVTLKKMTVSGSGRLPITGSATVAMRKMVVSASGKIKIPGTISVTMRKMQVHASEGSTVTGASSLFIFSQL